MQKKSDWEQWNMKLLRYSSPQALKKLLRFEEFSFYVELLAMQLILVTVTFAVTVSTG